jgi:hypothetical protein
MNTFAKFLSTGTLALLASASASFALDTDAGYGPGGLGTGAMKGANGRAVNRYAPQYFRPTQRFYGKGYTVAYRFIPWSDRMRGMNAASTWDIEQFRLPTNAAATAYANGSTPRITYFNKKSLATPTTPPSSPSSMSPTPPPSSIAITPKELPPIGEAPAKP